jgi:hypothetical protein
VHGDGAHTQHEPGVCQRFENELFVRPNTMMLFGDAKETLIELIQALKDQS